jgi:uncharacterized protein (TIGR03086 family)
MPQRDLDAPLETQVADAADAVLEAWRRKGVEGTVELASTQLPAAAAVGILSVEFLVHAWDFAMATDRHVVVSEPVCDYVQGLAAKIVTPQLRAGRFADAVTTSADIGALDRLIAFTGRQPAVVQTSAN